MSEKLDDTTQLQAFSFKKKPLENYINNSNVRSVISDMIPQSSSRPSSTNTDPSATGYSNRKLEGYEGYNNINYDEQIRAPRMSSVTQSFKDKEEDKDNSFVTNTPRMEERGLWSVHEDTRDKDELDDSYIPANFDLSQPTRRFSSAYDVASDIPDTTILSYTTNNYIYERNRSVSSSNSNSNNTSNSNTNTNLKDLNLEMLLVASPDDDMDSNLERALNNLKKNMTSRERNEGMKSSRIKHRPHVSASHLSGVNGTDLQQVYRLKKPLCIPAVLRPQSLSPPSSLLSPILPCSAETSPKKMNYSISFDCQDSPGSSENRQPAEPTHTHWKPDNITSYCMKCFEPFGNFFNPQRRRRHHCRFCGQIFCYDCLWQKSNAEQEEDSNPFIPIKGVDVKGATVLDAQARFVVPIYLNLHADSKIQSLTDLYRNCKVCKDCGYNYHMLVTNINSNLSHFMEENKIKNFTLPVIFIENSFVKNASLVPHQSHPDLTQRNMSEHASIETDAKSTHSDIHDASATATICAPSSTSTDLSTDTVNETTTTDPLKKSSVASVPSDWTWSSF